MSAIEPESANRPLRIAFLVEGMSSSGVDTSTQLLADAMRHAGHTVVIFSPWQGRAEDPNDPTSAALPPIKISSKQPTYLSVPISWSVYERFRRERFDLIHVHTSTTVNLIAWQMSSVLSIPIVYTYHTMTVEYAHYLGKFLGRFTTVVEPAIELFDRMVCNGADAIVAPSQKAADYLEHISVRPEVTVIPNGINLYAFCAEPSSYLRERIGIAERRPICIFVGRLNEEKRPMLTYQLFKRALPSCPEAVLAFVGDGALRTTIEEQIVEDGLQESVFMVGPVPYADMPQVYQSADIWLSTSLSEVHPMVALEATACGAAAVAIHDPALNGIILHDETGILAEGNDDFVAALSDLLGDPVRRSQLAQAGAAHAREFGVERTAERMTALYRKVLEENPPPTHEDIYDLEVHPSELLHRFSLDDPTRRGL